MRALVVVVCLLLGRALLLSAQQRTWSGSFAAGYGARAGPAFSGKGAVWTTVAAFRPLGSSMRGGLELGFHRFDTIESRIPDGYGPGSLIGEDFTRSFWQLSATARFRAARGTWRPCFGAGLGAYLVRVRDRFRTQDSTGALIPGLQFDQRTAEVKPGLHALLAIERRRTLGDAGLGLVIRGDVVAGGVLASVVSVGLTLALD
jgi:hypothetical protein